jgi:outer membrane immunogenic protein
MLALQSRLFSLWSGKRISSALGSFWRLAMKRLLSLAAALAIVGTANAADLPTRKAPPPVVVAPPLTWNGCYVGAFAGYDYARIRQRRDSVATTPPFLAAGAAVIVVPGVTSANSSNYTSGGSGGDGGARIGCNAQWGHFVAGIQAEGGALGLQSQSTDPVFVSNTIITRGGPYGALTGRLGFVLDPIPVYLYARGGGAFTDFRYDIGEFGLFPNAASRGRGFAPLIGAGLEYKLTPNASINVEYSFLRTRCGDVTYGYTVPVATALPAGLIGPAAVPATVSEHVRSCTDKHMVTVGLNYYFWTGAPAAVVARY